jgi:hypothetical protein
MMVKLGPCSEGDRAPDKPIRTHFNVRAKLRAGFDDRRGMDFSGHALK